MENHPPYGKQGGLWKIYSAKEYHFKVNEKHCKNLYRLPKKVRSFNDKEVDNAVYDWFILQKSQQKPIDDALMKEKAPFYAASLKFQALKLQTALIYLLFIRYFNISPWCTDKTP